MRSLYIGNNPEPPTQYCSAGGIGYGAGGGGGWYTNGQFTWGGNGTSGLVYFEWD